MINIQTQCCGLLILLVITYFYGGRKRVDVITQRAFLHMLIAANVCTLADIVSVFAIRGRDILPVHVIHASCKFYLMMLVILCGFGLLYISSDVFPNYIDNKKIAKPYIVGTIISCVGICITPVGFIYDEASGVIYSEGISTIVTYIVCFILIISMVSITYYGRDRINPRRRAAVTIWIFTWLLAALVQFLFPRILIVSFAGSVGVIIIYMMIENPEANIDKETGLFNSSALIQYMNEFYANGKRFAVINTPYKRNIVSISRRMEGAITFVGGGETFIIFLRKNKEDDMKSAIRILHQEFMDDILYVMPDSAVFDSTTEYIDALRMAQKIPKIDKRCAAFFLDLEFKRQLKDREKIERIIKDAMENDRIVVYYQPIYSTKEKKFLTAEALVRIKGKNGEIIPPGEFIPIAEENGSIIEIGKTVLEKVCYFISSNEHNLHGVKSIQTNISVVQGEDEYLADNCIKILDKYDICPSFVKLEITETASIRGKQQLIESMNRLISHGVDFLLDDFGTGQSNLDYVADMPVNIVKFDRNMTQGYFMSDRTKHIMHAAIQMVHEMGLEIVVEGIETEEQYQEILEEGVEYIQGYYFSKALPEDEFMDFIHNSN